MFHLPGIMDFACLTDLENSNGIYQAAGITGFPNSTFIFHIEESGLGAINIHGGGAPKLWCAVKEKSKESLMKYVL
jgi:hypothetical protein